MILFAETGWYCFRFWIDPLIKSVMVLFSSRVREYGCGSIQQCVDVRIRSMNYMNLLPAIYQISSFVSKWLQYYRLALDYFTSKFLYARGCILLQLNNATNLRSCTFLKVPNTCEDLCFQILRQIIFKINLNVFYCYFF